MTATAPTIELTNKQRALRILAAVGEPDTELLLALGLVRGESGSRELAPDDTADYVISELNQMGPPSLEHTESQSVMMASKNINRARFTTPPGLANYAATAAPIPPPSKEHVKALLRELNASKQAPCPSTASKARHKRHGETCEVCIADSEARKRKRPACGDPGGLMAHKWRGEEVCEPCRLAHNAHATTKRKQRSS